MAKIVVQIGYRSFILDAEDAAAVVDALSKGEAFEEKYHSAQDGKPSFYTYHVYERESTSTVINLRPVSDEEYQMYKLAGKPESK